MKILLFGGSGQLGFELKKRAEDLAFEVVSPVTSEVNITEREQLKFLAKAVSPDVIINCAAYTAVDKAEEEVDLAYSINRDGANWAAEAAKAAGCKLIHISTDYVFDGSLGRPLREEDQTNPLSVYGKSKLAGEEAVLATYPDRSLVVRTSSLHGQKGVNFVHTMLKLFESREVVRVVSDQMMSPTWAGWLAETLLDFARMDASGVFHASCEGAVSWIDFAREILKLAQPRLERCSVKSIEAITAAELQRPAKRPVFSAFDTAKLAGVLGRRPIPWQEGLKRHLMDIDLIVS